MASSYFDYKESPKADNWPSITDSYTKDWSDAFSRNGSSGSKTDWGALFSDLFDKTRSTSKYRSYGEQSRPYFSDGFKGGGGQIFENLSAVYPQQHGTVLVPGTQGSGGLGSTIGTIAGIGASFIPGLGPGIKAALPALGSNIGGLFG